VVTANIRSVQATVGKRVIAAPFAGTITNVGLKVGSVVSGPSSGTITLITAQSLQLESYVPEVNIAQIVVGDTALVTLDAYSATETFPACRQSARR
jgi:multidrug resistance efflux pump